jgi:hypothetical protein
MVRARRSVAPCGLVRRPSVMLGTVTEAGNERGKRKNPKDLPARREPKLPATVGPSGSGAPSTLRTVATRRPDRPAAARPKALRPPRLRVVRLATPLRGGGLPRPGPPCGVPGGAVASALRPPRPRIDLQPCDLRPILAPSSPCGVSGASPGLLVSILRLLGASEDYGRAARRSTRRFRRSEHISAGQGDKGKSDNSVRDVTSVTADDERAGQEGSAPGVAPGSSNSR